MNDAENDIALIEKHFDEGLSEPEAQLFEHRVKTDESFRALVEQEKHLVGAIRMQGLRDQLEHLKRIESSLQDPRPVARERDQRRWYLVAAALIGLLIVGKFVLSPSVTTGDIYQDHFKPYPNVFEPTVRGSAQAGSRTEAFKAYEKGDYSNAANLFTQLLQDGPDPGVLLLLGNCNLILGNTDDAIRNFSDLKAQSTELALQSNWFLSLAYLKNGDREQALLLLRELSATESSYTGKSRDIIRQLE